ncbi:hypothetical protein ACS0TY_030632 [Phlomoides rotata]
MSNLSALAAYFGYYFLCSVLLLAPLNTCQIKFHSLILYPCIYYLLLLTLLSSTMVGEKMNTPSDEQKKLNSGQIPTPEETKLKLHSVFLHVRKIRRTTGIRDAGSKIVKAEWVLN